MSIMGTRVIRTEDPRLLTVGGVYVDDLRTPGLNRAARVTFVRSPLAHARITGIDASEALSEPGVVAVLTVADMDDLAPSPPSSGEWDGSPAPLGGPWAEPLLAVDTVRFVGEPLLEEMLYDVEGNPLTCTLADYAVISPPDLPSFELVASETPTDLNPLGAKGIGEAGSIGSTPAVHNAVVDAVAHLGVRHIDMPATPQRVWAAINKAQKESE